MCWTCEYLIAGVNEGSRHWQVCTNLWKFESSSKSFKEINGKTSKHLHLTPLSKSHPALFFSNNAFGSQTGISPFFQPPPWYLKPRSYKLPCGLFRRITRLRIEDNWKKKIQREFNSAQQGSDVVVWVVHSRLLVWGTREDALFSPQFCLYWPQMAWHIFMAH